MFLSMLMVFAPFGCDKCENRNHLMTPGQVKPEVHETPHTRTEQKTTETQTEATGKALEALKGHQEAPAPLTLTPLSPKPKLVLPPGLNACFTSTALVENAEIPPVSVPRPYKRTNVG